MRGSCRKTATLTLIGILACLSSLPSLAQGDVTYVYDSLGRLRRVIDQQGNVATYNYDAVGNILSIERGDGGCPVAPPTISQVTFGPCFAGSSCPLTIDGNSLLGAGVFTDNPQSTLTDCRGDCTRITCVVNTEVSIFPRSLNLSVTTPMGSAQAIIDILTASFTISTATTIGPTDRRFDRAILTVDGPQVVVDGAHRFESLTVKNGAVVSHSPATATSMSTLDLTVDGLVGVDPTSRIDVSGKGYIGAVSSGLVCQPFIVPPQAEGCMGRTLGNLPGSRASASYAGLGTSATDAVYGDFRQPRDLGSGGGAFACGFGCQPGGRGGGAVKIAAGAIVLNGSILANGQSAGYAGSGGSVWLVTGALAGSGVIEASGVQSGDFNSSSGGGRVAIYYADASGFDLSRVRALGGPIAPNPQLPVGGGTGTVFLKRNDEIHGRLVIDNGGRRSTPRSSPIRAVGSGRSSSLTSNSLTDSSASFPVPDALTGAVGLKGLELNPNAGQGQTFTIVDNTATTLSTDPADGDMTTVATRGDNYSGVELLDQIAIRGKADFVTGDPFLPVTLIFVDDASLLGTSLTAGSVEFVNNAVGEVERLKAASIGLASGSTLTHPATTTAQEFGLAIEVTGSVSVDASSHIDVSKRGYLGGANNFVPGYTLGNTTVGGSGQNAGGSHGGVGGCGYGGCAGATYGDFTNPRNPGSGSGGTFFPCGSCFGGPGANGGGVARLVAHSLALDGFISADGDGLGAGGSISIVTSLLSGTGMIRADGGGTLSSVSAAGGGGRVAIYYDDASQFDLAHVSAAGGAGPNSSPGGAGTVFLKSGSLAHGDLIIDNRGANAPSGSTPLRAIGPGASTALASDVLSNSAAAFRTPNVATGEIGLIGLELNPNTAQGQTFTVVDNTATTLTIDASDGDLTAVAMPANSYVGVYTFDNLTVANGAKLVTADRCTVLATVSTPGGSVSCSNLAQSALLAPEHPSVVSAEAASPR